MAHPGDQLGYWLSAIIGTDTSTKCGADTAYSHAYSWNTPPTLRKSYTHVYSKGNEHGYCNGAMMKKLSLRCSAADPVVKMESEWAAWNETTTLTNQPGDPTYPTISPFVWGNTGIDLGDSSYTASPGTLTRGWELTIDRQATPFMGANGDGYIDFVLDGAMKITLKLDMLVGADFKTALKTLYQAGTLQDCSLRLLGALVNGSTYYTLTCDLDNMQIMTPPDEVMDDGNRYTTVELEAVYDSAQAISFILKNAKSAAYNAAA
jgi:hypothetical protein